MYSSPRLDPPESRSLRAPPISSSSLGLSEIALSSAYVLATTSAPSSGCRVFLVLILVMLVSSLCGYRLASLRLLVLIAVVMAAVARATTLSDPGRKGSCSCSSAPQRWYRCSCVFLSPRPSSRHPPRQLVLIAYALDPACGYLYELLVVAMLLLSLPGRHRRSC